MFWFIIIITVLSSFINNLRSSIRTSFRKRTNFCSAWVKSLEDTWCFWLFFRKMWKIYSHTRSENQRPVCWIFENSSSPCFRTDLGIVFFSCPCIILILSPLIKITTGSPSCLISTLKNVDHGQCCCCSLQLICILDLCWHYFFLFSILLFVSY